jgi:hypothetical protein
VCTACWCGHGPAFQKYSSTPPLSSAAPGTLYVTQAPRRRSSSVEESALDAEVYVVAATAPFCRPSLSKLCLWQCMVAQVPGSLCGNSVCGHCRVSYEPFTLADGEPLWRRIASQLMSEGLGGWGGAGRGMQMLALSLRPSHQHPLPLTGVGWSHDCISFVSVHRVVGAVVQVWRNCGAAVVAGVSIQASSLGWSRRLSEARSHGVHSTPLRYV